MKILAITLTSLSLIISNQTHGRTTTALSIEQSKQSGKHIVNEATSHVSTNLIGANITIGIGWTTQCPDSYDANVNKSNYHTLTTEASLSHQWLSEPTGWVNKWTCNKTYACIVNFKAIGLANFEASGTILGSGASISMQGAANDVGDVTTYMRKSCGELPCTTER